MKKVCHLTSAHGHTDTRIFLKECRSLFEAGYDVSLIVQHDKDEIIDGVKILGVPKAKDRMERMLQTTKEVYKRALECDADIYHFHDPELLPYGLKLKKLGKKVIFDSHEDTSEQIKSKGWIPLVIRNLISKTYLFYQSRILRKLDAVISVTPHVCEKLKGQNEKTILITNYPLVYDEAESLKTQSEDSEDFLLCFAGGVSSQWSHDYIVKALDLVPNVKYIVFGKASPTYIKQLATIKGFEKVDYCGVIAHDQVAHELKKTDVGMALCQYNENMGGKRGSLGNTKLFEYMLAGIPVICTDFEEWKKIIRTNNCGLYVNPSDVKAIAEAIIYLRDNPTVANEMGERGRKAVLNTYNWKYEEAKLLSLYSELVDISK